MMDKPHAIDRVLSGVTSGMFKWRVMTFETDSWPAIIYGTAWKEEASSTLTRQAILTGYRAVDTANQPRHYNEAGVGEGVRAAMDEGDLARDALFLQTKFTPLAGQGEQAPYDRQAGLAEQIEQSFHSSLEHLGTDYLDSYLLHGPHDPRALSDADWTVWSALETIHERGGARRIGVSNVGVAHLQALLDGGAVKPMAVQNRCFARTGWDRDVRALCAERGIAYQGFSLLTANPFVLSHDAVQRAARGHQVTPQQIVFAFARHKGMIPLTGTTDRRHMTDDLAALDVRLTKETVAAIESIAG